eukprot:248295_1
MATARDRRTSTFIGIESIQFKRGRYYHSQRRLGKQSEEYIQYPDSNMMLFKVKMFDDPSITNVSLDIIGKKYPQTMLRFILKTSEESKEMDDYVQRICVKPSSSLPINAIVWLKKGSCSHHRVVRIEGIDVDNYILPFMDKYHRKYFVNHVEFIDNNWRNVEGLNGGWISDNDATMISENDDQFSGHKVDLFVATKRLDVLKKREMELQQQYMDNLYSFMRKMIRIGNTTVRKQWTTPKWTFIHQIPPQLSPYFKTSNKSNTQDTYLLDYDALKDLFNGDHSEEIETKHGGNWILTVHVFEVVHHTSKEDNNTRIRGKVLKSKPPPPPQSNDSNHN